MEIGGRFLQAHAGSFFLFGPRGTGKSTWLRSLRDQAVWIDLLDPEIFRLFQARPERLIERVAAQPLAIDVVIDEVQKIPALLDVVHQLVEGERPLRFILTGSSARKLLPPYSPELNRIEKFWHTVKHRWMEVKCRTFAELHEDVSDIFNNFGGKFKFAFNAK